MNLQVLRNTDILYNGNSDSTDKLIASEVLEKVILGNDLSSLSPIEKVQYVKSICATIGLNPVTKPIQLMKFQGKEIPYFTKDATEQLRKINDISIIGIETKIKDGLYIVIAKASDKKGRTDSSSAVISMLGLKGDALANCMMKCETKAKRRVTLSICGLGLIDECEVESIPNAQKIDIQHSINEEIDIQDHILDIKTCQTLDELKEIFSKKQAMFKCNKLLLEQIIKAKDIRKDELYLIEFDSETGEIIKEDNNEI